MFVLLGRPRHPRVVGIVSPFLNVILFFSSGAVYPIVSFPLWPKMFAKINPEAHAVQALKSVLFKGSLWEIFEALPLSVRLYGDHDEHGSSDFQTDPLIEN
jgi:ABC-type multidrug transport system permease subunit